jgi:hypothetical protein
MTDQSHTNQSLVNISFTEFMDCRIVKAALLEEHLIFLQGSFLLLALSGLPVGLKTKLSEDQFCTILKHSVMIESCLILHVQPIQPQHF